MNSPFDNFIQEMLGNRNPQGNMLTGVSTPTDNFYTQALTSDYYNNRFKRPDSIDAGIAKRVEDEKTLYKLLGLPTASGMLGGGSGGGDSPSSPNTGQGPIGIGNATDAINVEAIQDAIMGFATGGVPGAIQSAIQSLTTGTFGLLGQVNSADDPLGAWITAQGYAPVPVVDMSTPYGGGASVGPPAAVTSPVDMSFSPSTAFGPMGDSSGGGFSGADAGGGGFGPSAPGEM
jgi:hypothetical protein